MARLPAGQWDRAAAVRRTGRLMKQPWLVIADLGSRQGQREERIYLAAELDPEVVRYGPGGAGSRQATVAREARGAGAEASSGSA
ncbi:hypothetical protein ACPA9J_34705 [Pseudomonas aeruginosa]